MILLVLSLVFGQNFFALLGDGDVTPGPGGGSPSAPPRKVSPAEEELAAFVSFVLDDVQKTWTREFQQIGREYEHARLVLFTDATRSGCGTADAAAGPFYCPEDRKVYIDLGFYQELKNRFGAPGDFAQAYVLAHEIGHHVQHLLGLTDQVRANQERNPSAPTRSRCASSFRPTAWPASGPAPPASGACSSRGTWRRRSARPPRWATTASSGRPAAA